MKEHPILFSAPMVRAILDGNKTQTRRFLKPRPWSNTVTVNHGGDGIFDESGKAGLLLNSHRWKCPYGMPGDRLWVRETWAECRCGAVSCEGFQYKADDQGGNSGWRWKPSIHMPRKASRIVLEVVSVRVERLNNISEEDAKAEGVLSDERHCVRVSSWVYWFKNLWESINGTGSWENNPWIWVVEFRRLMP